jgi:peptidoglycan/xylan/chitin deacetylase (PgdA/CDA1 family)
MTNLRNAFIFVAALSLGCSTSDPDATGGAGATGSAGTTGVAGTTGTAGTTGAAGTTGGAGTTGVAGTTGAAGTNGIAGTTGAAGTTGGAGTTGAAGTGAACPWPATVDAVVSLNYDDGLDTQLATVAPLLEARGLKASFFLANYQGEDHNWALPNLTSPLNERHMAWQAMVAKGHELSGHSVKHPCDAGQLASYTVAKFEAELDDNILRLKRLGAQPPFTFGYPCLAEQGVGNPKMSLEAGVKARFIASRKSPEVVANPATVDFYAVPNLEPMGKSAAQIRAMVDDAIAKKGWIMFGFHGVGAEKLSCPQGNNYAPATCMLNHNVTPADVHLALLDYLVQKKSQVWTATFKEAVQCFQALRK